MDKRKLNGGKREGSGRKPKADELALIQRLSPLDDIAFDKLSKGLKSGEFPYLKMFFEYRFGKPKEVVDVTTDGESLNKMEILIRKTGLPQINSEKDIN